MKKRALTVRALYVIDPTHKLRLSMQYPASTGRSVDEMLRVVDSLQLVDKIPQIVTPANWVPGEKSNDCPTVPDAEAEKLFPGGVDRVSMPSGLTYVQIYRDFPYPIIADETRELAVKLDMIDQTNKDDEDRALTVRALYVIDPVHKLRLSMQYPASTGRNVDEMLRVVDSLQLVDKIPQIVTPANWVPGEKVMIVPEVSDAEAESLFPGTINVHCNYMIFNIAPENATAEITDEDSRNEDELSVHNLPGSHLRAQAEIVGRNDDGFEFDDDDNISLSFLARPTAQVVSQLSKRKKICASKEKEINSEIFSNFEKPMGPKNNMSTVDYFAMFFDSELKNMIPRYANLYASQNRRSPDITCEFPRMLSFLMCFIGILFVI
ncbi:hypothetical protein MML48_3g00015136 [Holotrichia oblita]|uniref:Uncharacterized protein n=1 Tax=Holotrichia oblita TaxID=644536 RepID=A0ACB9TF35_HOLOL|nr:hypothetical protein MML48_3g00015136 [Holotrichia oblita]